MLAAMDEAVGQIAAAIDEAGMRKNTLFIFSSDNGGPSPGQITDNGPLRAGKGTLYEGGTRVVAFATWDGVIKSGSTVKARAAHGGLVSHAAEAQPVPRWSKSYRSMDAMPGLRSRKTLPARTRSSS
jgi:arylsulfatase A-like enzyme